MGQRDRIWSGGVFSRPVEGGGENGGGWVASYLGTLLYVNWNGTPSAGEIVVVCGRVGRMRMRMIVGLRMSMRVRMMMRMRCACGVVVLFVSE